MGGGAGTGFCLEYRVRCQSGIKPIPSTDLRAVKGQVRSLGKREAVFYVQVSGAIDKRKLSKSYLPADFLLLEEKAIIEDLLKP